MDSPVVLDAGPLVAILNRDDEFHRWAVERLGKIQGRIVTCETVIAEAYFLVRHIPGATSSLMSLLEAEVVMLRFDLRANLSSVASLMRKYHDIPMSLADECLVRMSETDDGISIFALDSDFKFYRRHGRQAIPLIHPAP